MPRQRATLSDLLADDVRDYFRREGVSSADPAATDHRPGRRRRSRSRWTTEDEPLPTVSSNHRFPSPRRNIAFPSQPPSPQHSDNSTETRRPKPLSLADAEFLRRYAEDRERADSRTASLRRIANASLPPDTDPTRPYRALLTAARPPTVAGSHRPGLASIDNDDWEEDDRIEKRDWKKMERQNGRSERHWRTQSGVRTSPQYCRSQDSIQSRDGPRPPWEHDTHSRRNSANTFVRKESTDSGFVVARGSSVTSSLVSCDPQSDRRHVRPLSYLSASSDSGEKSKSHIDENVNAKPYGDPSPLSSSNGTFKTGDRISKDGSDVHSMLWGSSIVLDSSWSPGESELRRKGGVREEDSSEEESSGSGEEEESCCTSDESSSEGDFSDFELEGGGANHNENGSRRVAEFSRESERLAIHMGKNYSSVPQWNGKKGKRRQRETVPLRLDDAMKFIWEKLVSTMLVLELYISNMPSLVGSLALAWSSLGVDWFKWYEESFDACHPTDYHNQLCVYPEFPGCFTCDTSRFGYQFSLHFHYLCSFIAILLALLLIGKILIAFPVVRDELANPTTAAPLGLLCMALEKSFGGNFGVVGMSFTFGASALQTVVAIWFIFISIVYKTLPEPSWFPNTTGLGLAAAKIFLYWSFGGYFLAGLSIVLFVMFYFVALYRIHANIKISAPVCWVQISGPAVVLYGFSIFGQPGSDEDELLLAVEENKQHFLSVHRTYFMPFMHFFFACCMVSMASALYCLSVRYKVFREKEFSPAHVGFCAPVLSHTNAMQVYRSAVKRFSLLPHDHAFKSFLYQYWTLSLISGSILVVILTWKFFEYLPSWCRIEVDDDEIPPEPEETILTKLLEKGDAKDEMNQDYVSAAVLQANESGALVRVLRDGKMKYMRSRRMPSMGFDPIMSSSQLLDERERLMQHLAFASSLRDRGGTNSFDDTLSSFYERNSSMASSSSSSLSSRRNRRNFMSFDASAMMRGEYR